MFTSFSMKNFRLFKQASLPVLSRVNLFVGKNNSGKTALLEAFYVFVSNGSLDGLFELIGSREESWDVDTDSGSVYSLRHLFHGRTLIYLERAGIRLEGGLEGAESSCLSLDVYLKTAQSGILERPFDSSKGRDEGVAFAEVGLVAKRNELVLYRVGLDGGPREASIISFLRNSISIGQTVYDTPKVNYVSTAPFERKALARLWDDISLTELEAEVIAGLRLIEPKIVGVVFVDSQGLGSRVPLVKLDGEDERLPLKSLGDGVFRLFYIILSLVSSKGGYLLIDEFENGIHWSVQEKLWNIVFTLAKKLDVQVFATTHSRDCVEAFKQCWGQSGEDEATFYRVNNTGEPKIKRYKFDLLDDSIENDVEVR